MLNLLKWDFIDYIKRYYWVYIGFAAAFILAVLPLPDGFPVSILFDGLSAAYCVFFYFFAVVLSIAMPIGWLRRKSAQLELSLPVKPWKLLLGKLVLSACILASTMLLIKLLELQAGKFGMNMYPSFIEFIQLFLFELTIVATIMFSYITAKSFAPTRKIAGLITVLMFIGIYALIVYIAIIPMNFTIQNTHLTPVFNNFSIVIGNPNSGLSTALSIALVVLFFFASSTLLKRRFERY